MAIESGKEATDGLSAAIDDYLLQLLVVELLG